MVEFKLPDIGEGVAEAEIVRWLVAEGDDVRENQEIVEVMTDKATVILPSPATGRIATINCAAGQIVPVGTVLVAIESAAGNSAGVAAAAATTPPASRNAPAIELPSPLSRAVGAPVHAMPATRRIAQEIGVDISAVPGTGRGGRVTTDDVKQFAASGVAVLATTGGPPPPAAAVGGSADLERVPLRGLRRTIAAAMVHAARTIPHFTFVAEVDMTEVVALRASLREEAARAGVKLTYLPFILRAVLPALRQFPLLNAHFDDAAEEIVLFRRAHIGIATATPNGLMVPVIQDAARFDLWELARELERLADGSRAGTLTRGELTGGTFTVTTTGARGGVLATPIIHAPEVAIMGIHEIAKKPVWRHDGIQVRDMTNFSLSLDHRVVDGAVAADFLYEVKANLEDPSRVPLLAPPNAGGDSHA